ncbi:MAG: ECF transporter S component [Bacillota bacterium]|nr:ECF transporter S component [Bacillota bacterium]
MRITTRELVIAALLISLVAVATMVIQIPVAATSGYINFGDTIIFASSLVFGPVHGLLAGGLGSAAADILSGYGQWAPFTLLVKGFEGLLCGFIFHTILRGRTKAGIVPAVLSMLVAGAWMVTGYFLVGYYMTRSVGAALAEVPGNSVQAGVSVILASAIYRPLAKIAKR